MKAVERFADRGFADAKLAREALLSKAGLFVEILVKDIVFDAGVCKRSEVLRGSQPFHGIDHAVCHSN